MSQSIDNNKVSAFAYLKKNIFYFICVAPAVLLVAAFFVVIITNLITFSFTRYSGGFAMEPTVQNYIDVVNAPEFRQAYVRTLLFTLCVTPLQLIAGLMTASVANRAFRGRGLVRGTFLVPLTLPMLVTASSFYILFAKGGIVNSMLMGEYAFLPKILNEPVSFIGTSGGSFILTVLVKVWRDTPASMLILLAGMQTIQKDQYEAAQSVGASGMQKLFYITIPLLMPSISSVLVLRSIEGWKEFVFPLVLSPTYPLLSMIVDRYFTQMKDPGGAAVVGIILVISILLFSQLLKSLLHLINKYLVHV